MCKTYFCSIPNCDGIYHDDPVIAVILVIHVYAHMIYKLIPTEARAAFATQERLKRTDGQLTSSKDVWDGRTACVIQ